jgi:histidinol-phosphatase
MLVARGAAHVMVEPELSIWDVAALQPIVFEAGGTTTHLNGQEWSDTGSCLTTNGALHDEIVRLARSSDPSPDG